MKPSYGVFIPFTFALAFAGAGCTTSGTLPPVGDGGAIDGSPGTDGSAPPGNGDDDSGPIVTGDDGGTTPTDGGTPVTDGASSNDGSNGGDPCADIQGSFKATAVSCNGTPVALNGLVWTASVTGTAGTFTETILGCSLTQAGPVACSNAILTVLQTDPNTCSPAACSPFTSQCGVTPTSAPVWSISAASANGFVLTSQNEPDGGPTPIQTCTAQHLSNPVQVTWVKQ